MSTASASIPPSAEPRGLFASRQGRIIQENLTAYLFLLPASLIIFVFGIFPVGFALYVSLHKWRLVQGGFLGLENYSKAIDVLAYVGGFWLGIGAAVVAVVTLRRTLRGAQERAHSLLDLGIWLIPAVVTAAGAYLFVRFTVLWLPEILDVPNKMQGQQRTPELFMQLLGESFQMPEVSQAIGISLVTLVVGLGLAGFISRRRPSAHAGEYYVNLSLAVSAILVAVLVLSFTYIELERAYAEALAGGEEPPLWSQIVAISAGVVLMGLAWLVWKRVGGQSSNARTALIIMAAALLMAGGWILIGELPGVIAEGDKDLFQGFVVTVFYSVGTVPIQLAISLFLAYLLFQNIRGKAFFRVIYFLPYITPAVASAAVFRILFTNRPSGVMNRLITTFGMEPQKWIQEPRGVIEMLGTGAGVAIPEWLAGPSLALMVIIIYSIWTFIGYDTVVFLAGLGAIPGDLYEAAEVDGAGRWAVFRHITLPLLSPTTFFLSLIAIIGTFKAFNHIWVLRDTGALGTTDTVSVVIFLEFFRNSRLGYASAMAFVLFGVILSLTFVQNRIASKRVFYG
ncbi:MAG: sugar ABC transporter permease [Anaerolineae bacterium]|nr:sugar ABC transporter permease [Anaerolineae bacterium]